MCTTAIIMYIYRYVQPTQKCEIEKGEKEEEDRDAYVPYIYNIRSINHSTASQTERKKRSFFSVSGRFKQIEPRRTFSNYILTEIARYIDFFHMSLGWFDWTEPSLTASLQGIEGVRVLYALVG